MTGHDLSLHFIYLLTMKNAKSSFLHISFVLIILALFPYTASAQHLKKKNLGLYTGTIPSYAMLSGEQILEVSSTGIQLEFKDEQQVTETIGSNQSMGNYIIVSESKTEIKIAISYPNMMVREELILDKKTHLLVRKGFYPQPDCTLKK